MNPIVASIPGRLRLRDPALRRPARLAALARELGGLKGVAAVEANATAGSLVLRYDPARLGRVEAEAAAGAAANRVLDRDAASAAKVPARPAGRVSRRNDGRRQRLNRQAKRGMLGSLAVSLALAAAGAKRWHAVSGALFLAGLAVHLAIHRRSLLQ